MEYAYRVHFALPLNITGTGDEGVNAAWGSLAESMYNSFTVWAAEIGELGVGGGGVRGGARYTVWKCHRNKGMHGRAWACAYALHPALACPLGFSAQDTLLHELQDCCRACCTADSWPGTGAPTIVESHYGNYLRGGIGSFPVVPMHVTLATTVNGTAGEPAGSAWLKDFHARAPGAASASGPKHSGKTLSAHNLAKQCTQLTAVCTAVYRRRQGRPAGLRPGIGCGCCC